MEALPWGRRFGSQLKPRLRSLVGHVLRVVARVSPWRPASMIVAFAEESPAPHDVADEVILRLRGLMPLDAQTLVAQYLQGLVPFGRYHTTEAYEWRRIDERGLITPETAKVPSGVRRRLAKRDFDIRFDTDSEEIIDRCRRLDGTWLNDHVARALHEGLASGVVTTIGAYDDDQLVGGEFGIHLNGWYCSMSTFHTEPGAGNALFARVVTEILDSGRFVACDVGEVKAHSVQFGAVPVTIDEFSRRVLCHLGEVRARRDGGCLHTMPAPTSSARRPHACTTGAIDDEGPDS